MKVKDSIEVKKEKKIKWLKVAIIILNWNGWKDTIECLESVFRNTYPNYQVVVVDNGSTDDSVERIKNWANGKQEVLTPEPTHPLYHLSHPTVKKPIPYIYYTRGEAERGGDFTLEEKTTKEWQEQRKTNSKELNPTSPYPLIFIQTGENVGFTGGNNVGIKYALSLDAKYVFILNNDTIIQTSNIIEILTDTLENTNNAGIIGPKIYLYQFPKVSPGQYKKSIFFRIIKKYFLPKQDIKNNTNKLLASFEIVVGVSGCSIFISREVFEKIGFFDERFFMYGEENDFCIRARLRGFLVLHAIKNVYILHKTIEKYFNPLPLEAYYSTRNMMFLIENSFSGKKRIYLIIFYFLSFIKRQFILLRNRRFSSFLYSFRGFFDGFLHKYGKFGN